MIRFGARNKDGRYIIGFGLSAENLKRLQTDQPIAVRLEDFFPDLHADVLIFFGKTEYEMTEKLAVLIGPATRIHGPVTKAKDMFGQ